MERCCTRRFLDFLDGLEVNVDEHHTLFYCKAFAHLRTEPLAPSGDWNGEALGDCTIRAFAGAACLLCCRLRCVPILLNQEQAVRTRSKPRTLSAAELNSRPRLKAFYPLVT